MNRSALLLLLVSTVALAAPEGWLDGQPLHIGAPELSADLTEPLASEDWRTVSRASAAAAWQADPDLAAAAAVLQPRLTRARSLTFAGPGIDLPGVADVMLDRLLYGEDADDVRAALATVVGGRISSEPALLAVMADESTEVRAALVGALIRSEAAPAVVAAALSDAEHEVRTAGLYTVQRRPDAKRFATLALERCSDAHSGVRAQAIDTVLVLKFGGSWEAGLLALQDDDAQVREAALRGMSRNNAAAVRGLEQAQPLLTDPSPAVRQLAKRVLTTPEE